MITHPATEASAGGRRDTERPRAQASLLDAVADLRRDVAATRFPLPLEGVTEAEDQRRRLLDQLDDHLLPRLRELSAPAIVVVAGSTGAGKSTLVNSVLRTEVSAAGVLRPTTRRPVLAHHPDDAALLAEHPLLEIVDVVPHPAVPRGIALVDAPDLDSLLASNRSTAHRLLEAADLWLFVTTAARYGDALPWEVLDRATERGTSMAMVLNRVPDDALVAVRGDLMGRLRARGMAAVPLFLVPDAGPHEGMLDAKVVAPIGRWLAMVAGPDRARSVIARTQRGSLQALRPWVTGLAEAVQAQVDARTALTALIEQAAGSVAERAEAETAGVADGPVRGTWASLASGGGPLAAWTSRRGRDERAEALASITAELRRFAGMTLAGCRRRAELAVVTALEATTEPGARGVLDLVVGGTSTTPDTATATTSADAAAAGWIETAHTVATSLAEPDKAAARRLARLARATGEDGPGALVALAAAGLGSARVVLEGAVGREPAREAAATLRRDLTARAVEQCRAGAQPALAALVDPDLADDAASRLRLRLAVLKRLT